MTRLRFFGGKGGAGKTTCAAAYALARAETGQRILVASVDPAHSLGDAFAKRLGPKPARIATRKGRLHAVELDSDAALDSWLLKNRPALADVAERGTLLDREDVDRLLSLSLPGVDALFALRELRRFLNAGDFDEVVVDTAPTGHTLRLLETPDALQRLAETLDAMQEKHRTMRRALGGRLQVDAGEEVIREIADEADALTELLRDPERTQLSWLLIPEPAAVRQANEAMTELATRGLPVPELVANRVTPKPRQRCELCDARRKAEAAALDALDTPANRLLPALDSEPRGAEDLRRFAKNLIDPRRTVPPFERAGSKPKVKRAPRVAVRLELPESLQLVVVGGKGGVGKTTCASGLALQLAEARPDAKVLLLSTDPAHATSTILGTPLDDSAKNVPGAPRNLFVRELDAPKAWAARRDRYRSGVDALFDALRGGSRFDATQDRRIVQGLLDLAPPGLDELLAVLTVVEALVPEPPQRPTAEWDVVVVDTAATGHALRLLEMPHAAHEWVKALLGILLKYRQAIGLGEIARELVELSRELRALQALLEDPARTGFVAVTRPAALPVEETRRLVAALAKMRIPLAGIVVNSLTPEGCARCRKASRAEGKELGRLLSSREVKRSRCVIVGAPAVAPPPLGAGLLLSWMSRWQPRNA